MSKKAKASSEVEPSRLRIAIIDGERCRPKKCGRECRQFCPVVRTGKECVQVEKDSTVAHIEEPLCIGCGICVKKCPFQAISVVNLPRDLTSETTHRYGPNAFKLHRLPIPRPGQVLGLLGTNGIGKSTAIAILAGRMRPNLGRVGAERPPEWAEVLASFKGGDLQSYFVRLAAGDLKAAVKPQYVDRVQRKLGGTVGGILGMKDDEGRLAGLLETLDLGHLQRRGLGELSGGEMQRFAIALACVQSADVHLLDEPSSFLDVRQRLRAAGVVRSLQAADRYTVVVEHDLAVLEYISDYVCCLWGSAGTYGVVTMPFGVREGINIFLDGKIPTENLRFREVALTFKISQTLPALPEDAARSSYPALSKTLKGRGEGGFRLAVDAGDFARGEIVVMLGRNGTGKTTFIKMLAGVLRPDGGEGLPELNVSHKPQSITARFQGTVRDLFMMKIADAFAHPLFQADVAKPMLIEAILDQDLSTLSGGELQRVALVLALGRPADIYLLDEPSAYLDAEQRVVAARVLKHFIAASGRTAFVVEHDFLMATYLADRVIVYDGEPGVSCRASAPLALVEGMNIFLRQLEITFRRDPTNNRPRINKLGSVRDREQKESGKFFVTEA